MAGDHRDGRRIGATEARLWALSVVGVAYWANILRIAGSGSGLTLASVVSGVLDNGAFDVFAWALLFAHAKGIGDDRPATPRALAAVVLLGVVVLMPARLAVAAALVLLGLLFFRGRSARLVLFALAFESLWMSQIIAPLHTAVASLDAQATAFLLRTLGQAASAHLNIVDNASSDFGIAIWPYCASSFPLADVGLAFVAVALYRGRAFRAAYLPWLAASFAASVVLTELRLVLLATDDAGYQWWHYGPGVSLYALAALGASVLFPLLATAARRGGPAIARPAS